MNEVKFGEILGPEDEATRAKRVRSKFWATLKKAARAIPFCSMIRRLLPRRPSFQKRTNWTPDMSPTITRAWM